MTTFSIRDGISRVRTEYGDVILDETNGQYWHANVTAVLVMNTIENGGAVDEAVERLMSECGVDHETARTDVTRLIDHLTGLGVLA